MTRFARPNDIDYVFDVMDRSGKTVSEISTITGLPFSNVVSAVKLLCYRGQAREAWVGKRRLYKKARV